MAAASSRKARTRAWSPRAESMQGWPSCSSKPEQAPSGVPRSSNPQSGGTIPLAEMLGEIRGVELFPGGALKQFGRRPAGSLRPDIVAAPVIDGGEIALGEVAV